MSWDAFALQLLRACDVSPNQLIQFLRPMHGRLPSNENAYINLQSTMSAFGHILEHAPNNIGQLI